MYNESLVEIIDIYFAIREVGLTTFVEKGEGGHCGRIGLKLTEAFTG